MELFIETHPILNYKPDTLDMMAESGMYVAEIGAEAGLDEMMQRIGKPIKGDDNIAAAVEMDRRGVQSITYIIGYPGESEESMMRPSISAAGCTTPRRSRARTSGPTANPRHGHVGEAVALGYEGPTTIPEWGSIGEYHLEERPVTSCRGSPRRG